jgi:hypothetical protein
VVAHHNNYIVFLGTDNHIVFLGTNIYLMLIAKNCLPCSFGPPSSRCATQQMLSPQHQMQQQQQ